MASSDEPARNVASKAQPGKEEDKRPELAGTNPAEWAVRPRRKERQDNEGHDRESDARPQAYIVDPLHERVQRGFLYE
jgi:hypothetical protein